MVQKNMTVKIFKEFFKTQIYIQLFHQDKIRDKRFRILGFKNVSIKSLEKNQKNIEYLI